MTQIESYKDQLDNFEWSISEQELDFVHENKINIGWYCSDRICLQGKAEKTALIWEDYNGEERHYSFNDMRLASNTIAAFLNQLGVVAGDRVCLFMDRIPTLYFGFLGILKTGAIALPLFSIFGEESLWVRMANAEATVIITQKKHLAKIRRIRANLPNLQHIILVDEPKSLQDDEIVFNWEQVPQVEDYESYPTTAESPSVLHYTSGTTGLPKGVMHVHYALISQYMTAKWVLDLQDNDIYWCTADPGWVTGTSYGIIGHWSNGITQCVLDAGFSAEAWYRFIEKHHITVWYSAPTAIRSLMKAGEEVVRQFDLSSLRHLASVGEPLNSEAVIWSQRVLQHAFHDSYWQTETGSIMISNYPTLPIKPGSMGKPLPGIQAAIVDAESYQEITQPSQIGLIAFRPGWPAMMRTYWKNEGVYQSKFHHGWYIPGDKAYRDAEGYFWFVGRDDDVINTGGHLISPFEVESALLEYEAIAESAVVSKPDEVNMEVVKAFIVVKPGYPVDEDLTFAIMSFIRKKLSSFAMPQAIEYVPSLPKTRSGKIMRRLLRAQEWGEEIGDTSTLEQD